MSMFEKLIPNALKPLFMADFTDMQIYAQGIAPQTCAPPETQRLAQLARVYSRLDCSGATGAMFLI